MIKLKHPAYVGLVFDALVACDDFMNFAQLLKATGCTKNQLSASLHNLQGYKAADCVKAPDGLHWFATPQTDTRIVRRKEIAYHNKPNRRGGKRAPKL